jgi:hypothetical protein
LCISGEELVVVGSTMGSLDSNANFGGYDLFYVNYDDKGG